MLEKRQLSDDKQLIITLWSSPAFLHLSFASTLGREETANFKRKHDYLQPVLANGVYGVLQLIRERGLVAASSSFRQLVTESRAAYDVAQEHAQ